jgi:hypothetical protein
MNKLLDMNKLLQEKREIKDKLKNIEKKIASNPLQIDKGRKIFSMIFSILDKSDIQYFLDNMTGFSDNEDLIKNGNKVNYILDDYSPPDFYMNTFFFNNFRLFFNVILDNRHESIVTNIELKDNNNKIISLDDDYYCHLDIVRERIEKTLENTSDSNKPFILLLQKFFNTEYSIDDIFDNLRNKTYDNLNDENDEKLSSS